MSGAAGCRGRVVALCGGVGGAKLALGLYRVLPPGALTVVVNTGDDFEHLGLHVSPDLDTVLYTLAGLADRERGWGRADETWQFMGAFSALGGENWFQLGDRDLALHVLRTQWLRAGGTLSSFTAHVADRLGIDARIVPMSDDAVRTTVVTSEGPLPFQRYFVARCCEPVVRALAYDGAEDARPAEGALAALVQPDLEAVVICPSNPYLSIDPLLAIPSLRGALQRAAAPVIAVSPIIGGQAVKGPTTKIMAELGVPAASAAIARHYGDLIAGLVIDETDAAEAAEVDCPVVITATLMRTLDDRDALARRVLSFARDLSQSLVKADRVHA